jgi:23S rRNA (pseudouridine1915-N3)-methyltransferase
MPGWVDAAVQEYAKRLPRELAFDLRPVKAVTRTRGADPARARQEEGQRLLAAVPESALVVALDERGTPWTTDDLARELGRWMRGGRDVAMLVGGADGLPESVRSAADAVWSLSPLTFPHGLVRVIVAEQVYRAWTVLRGHPYHRG